MINLQFLFPSMKIFVIFLLKMIGPSSTEANDTHKCILFKDQMIKF